MSRRTRISLGIAIATLALPGCLHFLHPLPEPTIEMCNDFQAIPEECRAGVYVFMVNGNDPLSCANLKGVRDFLTRLGFVKAYCGEIAHEGWMAEELVCINRDLPGSRFVVVGFEYGADSARRIVQAGLNKGATIDMLLYLEPKGSLYNVPLVDEGVRRTVLVQNDRWLTKPAPVDNAEIITVCTASRYGVPTHPEVLDLLLSELTQIAHTVPIVIYAPEGVPPLLDETAPPPRPIPERKAAPVDDWDFLKLLGKQQPAPRNQTIADVVGDGPRIIDPREVQYRPIR